jgi:hypothetical protein
VVNPQPTANYTGGVQGSLYGYNLTITNPTSSSFGSLGSAPIWDWNPYLHKVYGSPNGGPTNACSSSPTVQGWFPPAFTEPTLAANQQYNGSGNTAAVYVATVCAETDIYINNFPGCAGAYNNNAHLTSGIMVFTRCPGT